MKTILKITAIMAIAALIPLSCSPEVELTERNWSERDSNRPAGHDYAPMIAASEGLGWNANLTPEQRELTITFPASADFLKAPNDQLVAKLNEFLSVYSFTTPTPASGENRSISEKKDIFEIEALVSRTNTSRVVIDQSDPDHPKNITIKEAQIKLRFKYPTSFPASQQSPALGIVAKFEGAKYTFGGVGIDCDNDGVGGEADYDDHYMRVGRGPRATGMIDHSGPVTSFSFTISSLGSREESYASGLVQVTGASIASIEADAFGGGTNGTARNNAVLESLRDKLKIQKFSNGSWVDVGATIRANGAVGLVADYTHDDLGIYRVYAEGLKGFKTSHGHGAISALGAAEQKLSLSNASKDDLKLRTDKFASDYTGFYANTTSNRLQKTTTIGGVLNHSYDSNGKKASFELLFNKIVSTPTPPGSTPQDYYVTNDVELFKKYVRVVFRAGAGDPVARIMGDADHGDVHNNVNFYVDSNTLLKNDSIVRINGQTVKVVTASSVYISVDLPITAPIGTPVYLLSELDFQENKDLVIAKINSVKFDKYYYDSTQQTGTAQTGTKVTITLDEGIRVEGLGEARLAIAPALPSEAFYTTSTLVFGDFTAINQVIDGIHGWSLYDKIYPVE